MKGLIGKKIGMTQLYDEAERLVPVTVIQAGPCKVIDRITEERNGYSAIQLGFGEKKAKNESKAVKGHCQKVGIQENPPAVIREFRIDDDGSDAEVGADLTVGEFEEEEYVDVIGTTKGRGFQGVVKRHDFSGGQMSHGCGWKRKGGSVGQCEFPGHIEKGKKMPGHMGSARRTVQNLKIMRIDKEQNLLFVKGAVPGAKKGVLLVQIAKKKQAVK